MTPSQDGITVRQMRLKVLYTFDSESKTTCLARWPHLLDIQTAYLDEDTQVGVIELRTCIQAIVSASPELVARISNDYTIYAYDYSEYETPLVGQGMLSWILAATSTTPDAPAHQSKTIVTGRVCKNVGPFSRGAQETLEVRLKLVPVPISLQTEYNNSMAKYRDTANALCSDFDIERWASFVQQNHSNGGQDSSHSQHQQHYASCPPAITDGYTSERERCSSPSARSGIEHFQALLTECATPRDLGSMSQVSEGFRAGSPALSVSNNNSNNNNNQMTPTPRNNRPASPAISIARPASRAQQTQQQLSYHQPLQTPQQQQRPQQPQPQQQQQHSSIQKKVRGSRSISRANSMSHNAPTSQFIGAAAGAGPGNCTSGYDSSDEAPETSAPKRAKLMKPARPNLNIEKQRTSLLKAASNAASVRIHRPRPTKPGMDGQVISTGEEHIRPPTPVPKGPINPHHYTGNNRNSRGGNARGSTKLRRHSSLATIATASYTDAAGGAGAGAGGADDAAAASSSEDCRDNGMPETPLNIPSSPPVFENMYPQTSSPGLPPLPDYDSGFMSGGPDGAMSDDCNGGIRQAHGVDFRPQNPQPPQQQQQQQPQDQMYKSSKPNETKNAQQGKFVPILPALPPSAVPTSDAAEPLNFSAFAPNPSTTAPVAVTNTISAPAPPQQLQLHPQSQQPRQLHENLIHQYPMQQPSQPSQHPPLPLPQLGEISRPSSRASYRHRPLAPAPPSGSQPPSCPATDPIASPTFHVATPQMAKQKYDFPVQVPATSLAEASRIKSGARRTKQVKNRLNQCIKEGSVPPYCQNCGAIETPTWRRAWYKVIEGNEETAKGVQNDVGALFWEPFDKDDDGTMTSFKQFKKTLAPQDTKFTQLCLCNPCGLYLYKMEKMRPENMWNKSAQKDKRKKNKTRPPLRPLPGLDHNNSLSTNTTTTTTATVAPPPLPLLKPSVPSPESSPTRSPHDDNKEEEMTIVTVTVTPGANDGDNIADVDGCGDDDIGDNGSTGIPDESGTHQATETTTPTMAVNTTMRNVPNEEDNHSPKHFQSPTHKRASSEQPPTSAEKRMRMDQGAAMKALKKAIQASPARNFNTSAAKKKQQQQQRQAQDDDLTPKPVCRNLFPTATANANANANAGATSTTTAALSPKPLGTTPGNVLKTSPVKHQQYQGVDSTMQLTGTEDKENEYPSLVGRIEDFFHNHSTAALDLALPVTPTKSQHCQSLPPQSEQSPVGFSPKNSLTPFKKNEVSSVWNSTPPFGSGSESVIETELDSNPLLETDLQSTSCLDDVFVTNIDSFSPQVSSLPPSGAPAADCSQFPDWEEWIASLGTAGGDGSHSGDGAGGQAGEHNPFDADFSFLQAAGDEALKSLLLNDITAGDDHTPTTLFDDFLALPPPPHHMNNNVGDADVIDGFDKEFQGLEETDLNVILDGARAAAAATTATVPSTTANVDASKTTMATTAPITAEANPIKGTAIGAEGVSVAPAQAQ